VRLALQANPKSGGSTDPASIQQRLERLGATVVEEAEAERLVVAGGDGSVAPAAERAGVLGVPLAVLPTGTANDFARATGLPEDLDEACTLAARGRATRTLDLGRKDDRPFVNACSAGLAVDAARSAAGLKKALGPLAYAVGAVRAGATASPVTCRLACDGREVFDGSAWQVIVAGTGHFGAGSHVEEADDSDGCLDVAVVEAGSRLRLVQRAYGLRSGRVTDQRGVHHARGCHVVLEGDAAFNLDGELVDPSPRTEFTIQPRAFRLVVPG